MPPAPPPIYGGDQPPAAQAGPYPYAAAPAYGPYPAAYPAAYPTRAYPVPVYYPVAAPPVSAYPAALPRGRRSAPEWLAERDAPGPDFGDMPASRDAPAPQLALVANRDLSRPRAVPTFIGGKPAGPPRLGRLSLSAWALVRQPTPVILDRNASATSPISLASGGQLGGSQAGARLTYRMNRALAANLRV